MTKQTVTIKWGRGVSAAFCYGVKAVGADGLRLGDVVGAYSYKDARAFARNMARGYRQWGFTVKVFPYR